MEGTIYDVFYVWWCFTLHVTHPKSLCEIRSDVGNCEKWLKAYHSVRSYHRDNSSPVLPLCLALSLVWNVDLRNGTLYFSSILQEWQNTKKNDTDYGRFMRVINRSSFMPLKTAFPQLLSHVSKWLMTGLFFLLVHSLSCLCSVSHPRCRSSFTIQMTLTASALPSRKDASSQPWLSSSRYSIIKTEGRHKCNLKKTMMAR